MKTTIILIVCVLLAVLAAALLAVSYHRVVVVEAISGTPIPGAYISLERPSGAVVEVGQTGTDGKLAFWSAPLPLPRTICASSTFHPPACVSAIRLTTARIELAVP